MSSPQMTRMFGFFGISFTLSGIAIVLQLDCVSFLVSFVIILVMTCRLLRVRLRPDDQSKSNVARRGIHWLRHARCRPIAAAVIWRAQERAALDHLAGDSYVGRLRIVTLLAVSAFANCASTT